MATDRADVSVSPFVCQTCFVVEFLSIAIVCTGLVERTRVTNLIQLSVTKRFVAGFAWAAAAAATQHVGANKTRRIWSIHESQPS